MQIERITDKDEKEIKRVKLILIKKEIEEECATQAPFKLGPNEDIFLFMDDERVPFADQPYESKSEEETDDESYVEDAIPVEIDSDSSVTLSMTDDDFETTDPDKIDQALQEIIEELHQAANGYETLRSLLLPIIPVTEVAEVVQAAPTLYLKPMSKIAIQAVQTIGEEH